jgi:hypothetical protein
MVNAPQTNDRTNTSFLIAQALFRFFFLLVVVIGVSGLISFGLLNRFPLPTDHQPGSLLNAGPQFTMLTLVIAVAAYLATLARLLKDRITSLKKAQKEDDAAVTAATKTSETEKKRQERLADIDEHAANIDRLIAAEMFTVILGLLVGFRVLAHPFASVSTHSQLATYFGVKVARIDLLDVTIFVVLFEALVLYTILHARQWQKESLPKGGANSEETRGG